MLLKSSATQNCSLAEGVVDSRAECYLHRWVMRTVGTGHCICRRRARKSNGISVRWSELRSVPQYTVVGVEALSARGLHHSLEVKPNWIGLFITRNSCRPISPFQDGQRWAAMESSIDEIEKHFGIIVVKLGHSFGSHGRSHAGFNGFHGRRTSSFTISCTFHVVILLRVLIDFQFMVNRT